VGEDLYLHGSIASRMLKALEGGAPVCVTVTLLDGLVLARSAFHHSMNYRSVVILGMAREVTDAGEKRTALDAIVEHVVPGRLKEVRGPSAQELQATLVLSLPITEASAKVRSGPPVDLESDYGLPCWAGVIPLRMAMGQPEAEPRLAPDTPIPETVARYARGNQGSAHPTR
jgi:nitroimidazol reductase NimA-like FMN-containing flavoprotein (pyridoxamine 5'-phosphate oxidase superfamily)